METTNNREVNPDTESIVLDIGNEPDEEEDEQAVPPLEEDETEPPPPPPDQTSDTSEPSPDEPPLKEVKGETPKERAMRRDLMIMRRQLREAQQKTMLQERPVAEPAQPDERLNRLRAMYSDEEFKNVEDLVDFVAESKGYVKKEQTYQETANQMLETFLEDHPEYKPENDPDDVYWGAFQRALKDYNVRDRTPRQLLGIYKKIHRDVQDEFGESDAQRAKEHNRLNLNAQREKIRSVSHSGGGTKPERAAKAPQIDPSIRGMFKGFSDEDFTP